MPRKIKLVISGKGAETDAPAVEDVLDQLRDYHDILKEVEEAVAEDGKRAIDWRIVNASRNSPLSFEFEAFPHEFAVNIDRRAESRVSATAVGMDARQTRSERPPYFNDKALAKIPTLSLTPQIVGQQPRTSRQSLPLIVSRMLNPAPSRFLCFGLVSTGGASDCSPFGPDSPETSLTAWSATRPLKKSKRGKSGTCGATFGPS
jgi:hypothetical protein